MPTEEELEIPEGYKEYVQHILGKSKERQEFMHGVITDKKYCDACSNWEQCGGSHQPAHTYKCWSCRRKKIICPWKRNFLVRYTAVKFQLSREDAEQVYRLCGKSLVAVKDDGSSSRRKKADEGGKRITRGRVVQMASGSAQDAHRETREVSDNRRKQQGVLVEEREPTSIEGPNPSKKRKLNSMLAVTTPSLVAVNGNHASISATPSELSSSPLSDLSSPRTSESEPSTPPTPHPSSPPPLPIASPNNLVQALNSQLSTAKSHIQLLQQQQLLLTAHVARVESERDALKDVEDGLRRTVAEQMRHIAAVEARLDDVPDALPVSLVSTEVQTEASAEERVQSPTVAPRSESRPDGTSALQTHMRWIMNGLIDCDVELERMRNHQNETVPEREARIEKVQEILTKLERYAVRAIASASG